MFTIKHIDAELQNKRRWFSARDVLFGENACQQDIGAALTMMRNVDHEDARWLVLLFPYTNSISKESVHRVFVSLYDVDPRAKLYDICMKLNRMECAFYGPTSESIIQWEITNLKDLADKGYVLAGLRLVSTTTRYPEKRDLYLQRALDVGEPEAYYILGSRMLYHIHRRGLSDEHHDEALGYLQIATNLGYCHAQLKLGQALLFCDPLRHYHIGKAALRLGGNDLQGFADTFRLMTNHKYTDLNPCRYRVGEALAKHFDARNQVLNVKLSEEEAKNVKELCLMYNKWCYACKQAVHLWTLIARKHGVPKDVRVAVAKWLWDKRSDADYTID